MHPQFMFLVGKPPIVLILVPFLCILGSILAIVSQPILWFHRSMLKYHGRDKRIICSEVCYNAVVVNNAKLTDCAICLMDFEGGDALRVLPDCGHGFHVDCVKWLKCNFSCPSCRAVVVMESDETRLLGGASADAPPLLCDTSNPFRSTFWQL